MADDEATTQEETPQVEVGRTAVSNEDLSAQTDDEEVRRQVGALESQPVQRTPVPGPTDE